MDVVSARPSQLSQRSPAIVADVSLPQSASFFLSWAAAAAVLQGGKMPKEWKKGGRVGLRFERILGGGSGSE